MKKKIPTLMSIKRKVYIAEKIYKMYKVNTHG